MRKALLLLFFFVIFLAGVGTRRVSVGRVSAQFPQEIGAQRAPAIDVDRNDSLYLFMCAATSPNTVPHSQIFFTISSDGGATFDNLPKTLNLSNSRGEAFAPAIVVTKVGKPKVYAVYQDSSPGPTQAQLIFSKKRTNFRDPVDLATDNTGSFFPRIALDSTGAVNIVWGDTANLGRHVTFVRYPGFDFSFGNPARISGASDGAFNPDIAIDSNDAINVAWEDGSVNEGSGVLLSSIMFARSTDHGQSFSLPVKISRGPGNAAEVRIAVDQSNGIHVTWADHSSGDNEAYYSRSTDGGQTFSEPLNISASPNADIHKPVIAIFHNQVFIAYEDDSDPVQQVFLAQSSDRGVTFSRPTQISHANTSRGQAHSPAMVVDSQGKLHIVWIDSSILGKQEGILFYSNSGDGRTFSGQKMILAAL